MNCVTAKPGVECTFMKKEGCSFNGGICHQVIDNCMGCDRVMDMESGSYCKSFPDPNSKWKRGSCNFATHVKGAAEAAQKINPLKASKRSRR